MNWLFVVTLVGAVQGVFIAYLLLAGARRAPADRWLGWFVAAYGALCLGDALANSGAVLTHPDLTAIFDFCVFLLGPLLYQYVRILTGRPPLGVLWVLHLIPAGLLLVVQVFFHMLPFEWKRQAVAEQLAAPGEFDPLKLVAVAQILAYLVASLVLLRRHAERLKQNYSSIEHLSFLWLRNLLVINGLLWLVWAAGLVVRSPLQEGLEHVGFPVAAYVLAAFALRAAPVEPVPVESAPAELLAVDSVLVAPAPAESALAAAEPVADPPAGETIAADDEPSPPTIEPAVAARYEKSRVPEAILERHERRLAALMATERVYRQSQLTLPQLAALLGISSHHLSQLLNERLGTTFFDYVNGLRVADVEGLLRDPKSADRPILELAFRAGFNSKSTFNSIFKRTTGRSPSEFRKLFPAAGPSQGVRTSAPIGSDDSLDSAP